MNIKKLAIKRLNSPEIKTFKKQFARQFKDKKCRADFIASFDKSFINTFVKAFRTINI
jgi:hypothetical protein